MTIFSRLKELVLNVSGPLFWDTKSYAQEGEDLVLVRLFGRKKQGFYVEVGCHHPFRFSNTYLFYKRGWRGICVDPFPGTRNSFQKWRPRDITLEIGVSAKSASLTYYMFNEPALNTFDAGIAAERDNLKDYRLIDRRTINTQPLSSILENHVLSKEKEIDFFSIDVEGFDLEVLQSNDWERFRPTAVIVECLGSDIESLLRDPVASFMKLVGYVPHAKTGQSVIFVNQDGIESIHDSLVSDRPGIP